MIINGIPYSGSGRPIGVSQEVYDARPCGWPLRPLRTEVEEMGKVGGLCVGTEFMTTFANEMAGPNRVRYLEVGTFDGVLLSKLAAKFPTKEFHAVDAFRNTRTTGGGNLKFFLENCKGLDNIYLYVGESVKMLPKITGIFGFIFVDGEHSYVNAKFDLFYCFGHLLESGAFMAIHDRSLPGVGKACAELTEHFGVEIHHRDIGDCVKKP